MMLRASRLITAVVLAALLAGGCARKPTVLTGAVGERRVGEFDVAPPWLAYTWTTQAEYRPDTGFPIHLALRNLETGAETELEPDWPPQAQFVINAGRLAYTKAGRDAVGDLILRDAAAGTQKTVAQGKFAALDLDGNWLVWAEGEKGARRIVLRNLADREQRELATMTGPWTPHPRIDANRVAWTQPDADAKGCRLCLYDIAAQQTQETDLVQPQHFDVDLSGDYVVYALMAEDNSSIHLYQVSSGKDRVIAAGRRYTHDPRLSGDAVVWAASVPRNEFVKVPGQPLITERYFRDIFRYSISRGEATKIAAEVFWSSREPPGQMVTPDGKVYAAVEAAIPRARQPLRGGRVDVCRW